MALAVLIFAMACTPGLPPGSTPSGTSPAVETPPTGAIAHVTEARSSVARNPIDAATREQLAEAVAADRAFAFDLYQAMRAEQAGNLFISPYSISTALSMVLAGARGETADELAGALHAGGDEEVWHLARNRLELELVEGERTVMPDAVPLTLEPTNAIFGQAGYPFKQDFLDTLAANYGAGLNAVDFASQPEVARMAINEWVAERTRERIQELLPRDAVTAVTRAVLVNAIYFMGTWVYQFDPEATEEQPFHLADGTTVRVPMMEGEARLDYVSGDGWQAIALPYHGQASMLVIVPEHGQFAEVEELLDAQFAASVESALAEHDVDLQLPRWETESQLDLIPHLRSLGVQSLFDDADLSGIADEDLFVSDVVHAANITVDEEGTEAAAATGVAIPGSAVPVAQLTVDRPFIYLIRDDVTGEVLFLGRLLEP